MTQTEAQLETNLITQLGGQGYDRINIPDEAALLANLKLQLEAHNNTRFSAEEFTRILAHLDQGNVFDRAKTLRDRYNLKRDDDTEKSIQFLNTHEWCRNGFQVTNQITQQGRRVNRYDVTILINGLPLVHIELKRRGIEIAEAFNQINRYQRDSFSAGSGLFQYVQLFVISNGVNTKYYANQRKQSFMQTFFWAGKDNKQISGLSDFATTFLDKCHIAKMISRHIVLHETNGILMVLRPYQVYAVEAIIERVKNTKLGGYIWHTTGSGKTLTSFKAAQLIAAMPEVDKILFVVDRVDLDYQTMREFNAYQKDAVDGSANTNELVAHFANPSTKLVVTTIQKLNKAISTGRHNPTMTAYQDKRVVMIFDECHRSQFGSTHHRITNHFQNAQLFGFTGTPIFKENAVIGATDITANATQRRTTEDLFGESLHQYVITDAIRDKNVLGFSIEYWGRLKRRDGSLIDDEMVAGIDRREFFESQDRIEKICDWILAHHNRKTHDRAFTAMFAAGSIASACMYYDRLKTLAEAGKHNLKIATIFSSPANEDDPEADGHQPSEEPDDINAAPVNTTARTKLDAYIKDYNTTFETSFNTSNSGGFHAYYQDIGQRIKSHDKEGYKAKDRIDILLVVNMFLTGFDALKLNTMYVDKSLRQHGLIQAFSRTNRIFNAQKSHGNIISFRNLKQATDDAIALFSDKDASGTILIEPYEDHLKAFNDQRLELLKLTPTPNSVDQLADEKERLTFIKAFRELMRIMNTLKGFAEFKWGDVILSAQIYEDFKSKYLDLYDAVRRQQQMDAPASILDDIDFELDLIRRDEINVHYILSLLADAPRSDSKRDRDARAKIRKTVSTLLETEVQLRSKRDLIEKFIDQYWNGLKSNEDITTLFENYWQRERQSHLNELCEDEELELSSVETLIGQVNFTGQPLIGDAIIGVMQKKPMILERRDRIRRASNRIMDIIEIFEGV